MSIRVIPGDSVNRICASQVIDSVSACIRELVENALDAGSDSISVRIRGKCEEIEVADNGCGIPEEDWKQVCEAHSTSKLESYDQIYSMHSKLYGFRGEALSAICRLSQMTRISTRTPTMESGRVLIYDNSGHLYNSSDRISKSIGTTVTIYGLFKDSLPVRYIEALNSFKRELKIVRQQITELAIANHDSKFDFVVDGKTLFCSRGGLDSYEVYKQVVSSGCDLVRIKYSDMSSSLQIQGWVASPDSKIIGNAFSNGFPSQFFFINRKPLVPPKWVAKSISNEVQASFIIFVDSIGDRGVDRNASVDKRTVIFTAEVQEQISGIIRQAIIDSTKSKRVRDMTGPRIEFRCSNINQCRSYENSEGQEERKGKRPVKNASARVPANWKIEKLQYTTDPNNSNSLEPSTSPNLVKLDPVNSSAFPGNPENQDVLLNQENADTEDLLPAQRSMSARDLISIPMTPRIENGSSAIPVSFHKEMFLKMEIVGQFNNGFIITRLEMESPQLFLVDQHAANEKFLFEQYYNGIQVHPQALLSPKRLRMSPCQEETAWQYRDRLSSSGFKLSFEEHELPGSRVSVHSLPTLTGIGFNRSAALTTNDLLEILGRLGDDDPPNGSHLLSLVGSVRTMFASKACRTAVMVGDILTQTRMSEVICNLAILDSPWNCPHGRPTVKHLLSYADLDHLV